LTDLGLTDGTTRQIVEPLIDCRETPATNPHNNNHREPEHGRQHTAHRNTRKLAGAPFCPALARQHATYRVPRGITGFLAAAYLLVVIPGLLAAGGMDKGAVTTARFWFSSPVRC
jgi:hypothetical protein